MMNERLTPAKERRRCRRKPADTSMGTPEIRRRPSTGSLPCVQVTPQVYNLTFLVRIGVAMQTWQMQEAKARLSEVVKRAELDGPQDITLHGRSVAVVLSRAAFERLSGQMASLVDFMQASPLVGLDEDLVFERDASPTREFQV